jgi:hypothetical protein
MELKDNFTNRYFKPNMAKTQMDLINQPTATDAYADAFSKGGQGAADGPAGHEANALMSGLGAGLKGSANDKRQEQLDPILKQAGQINAQAAYLESQMQEEQQEAMQVQQFVKSQSYAFSELAKASTAGDTPASNNIARGILQQYKNTSSDPIIGDFDHYHDGIIYYSNAETGEKGGLSVSQLISQSGEEGAQSLGADYPLIMSAFSTGFKGQYENTQELQRLQLEEKRAGIGEKNAQANHHNAQVGKIEHDINAPKPKYDDSTLSHIRKANSDWINELNAKHKDSAKAVKAQTQMRDAIQTEINEGTWQTGASALAQATRWLNEKTGDVKTKQLLELKRQPLFKDLKNTFGARITDNDLAMWLTTQVDLSTDPNLAIEVLNERIDDSKSEVNEELIRRQILENEFQNSESYNSLLVDERVQEELGTQQPAQNEASGNQNQNMVKATDPNTGEQMLIPAENAEEARTRGLVIDE